MIQSFDLRKRVKHLTDVGGREQGRLHQMRLASLFLAPFLLALAGIGSDNDTDEGAGSTLEIRILDPQGKLFTAAPLVPASRGYAAAFPELVGWPDHDGWVRYHDLAPGEFLFTAATGFANRATFNLSVPEGGLRTTFQLGAEPVTQGIEPGKPTVDANEIRIPYRNRSGEPRSFQRSHLTLAGLACRIFPPPSETDPFEIPPGEETVVTIDWEQWVEEGIWAARHEEIGEKWPADEPGEDRIYLRAWLGNSASVPFAVPGPEGVLVSAARAEKERGAAVGKWTRRLPHGVEVTLAALGRPRSDRSRWWNPEGEPVTPCPAWIEMWERYGMEEDLAAVVQVRYSKLFPPTDEFAPIQTVVKPVSDEAGPGGPRFELGLGAGPWKPIPLRPGQLVQDGDFFCQVKDVIAGMNRSPVTGTGGSITVDAVYTVLPDRDVALQVIDKSGNPHDVYVYLTMETERPESGLVHQLHQPVLNVTADEVDRFSFWTRPRYWATFAAFATEPPPSSTPVSEGQTRKETPEIPWGEAVEGVEVRLRPDGQVFTATEEPRFRIDVRSETERELPHYGPPLDEFEAILDDQRYRADYEFHGGLRSVHPSRAFEREGIHFGLAPRFWHHVTDGATMELRSGTHALRVVFPFPEGSETRQALSNQVRFEILSGAHTGKEFLGLDLTDAPQTSDWAQLPDLFEERPPGSKSYELRDDVIVARHPEKQMLGDVLYVPRLHRFYVQHDPIGSSRTTFYGPFEGEPWARLGIPRPGRGTEE